MPRNILRDFLQVASSGNSRPDDPCIRAYMEWKGQKCAEIGANALIDDMGAFVISGCRRYSIAYFHPTHF